MARGLMKNERKSSKIFWLILCLTIAAGLGISAGAAGAAGFGIGDTVRTTTNLNVRTGPGTGYPEITDTDYPGYAPTGTTGTVLSGPSSANDYIWWKVDYGPGLYSGWSVEDGLEKVTPITDQQKRQEILNMANSHRGLLPAELVLAVIRQEGGEGAFYVDGWRYNSFYSKSDAPWAQPTNGDGIMQVTSASGYHEGSGPYTHDKNGYDHAINDGCGYLLEQYNAYGSFVQTALHYNTGPNSLWIYLGKNWGDRSYLSHVSAHLTNFIPNIYGIQNQDLADKLNQGQNILNNYLYNKGIATGQSVDYYRPYQTQLDNELHNIGKGQPSPVITSSLRLTQSPPHYAGSGLTAQFTIKNKGTASITFDVLTAGGRFNDGKLPNGEYPDFTWRRDITLNPDGSYSYQGYLTPSEAGNYHFFCAYRTLDGSWNPVIPTESGVTNALDIVVYLQPECYSNSDCGTDGWTGSSFCSGNGEYQYWRAWTCNNAGQPSAYCSYTDSSLLKMGCGDDSCGSWANYCESGDVYEKRTCYDRGCSNGACYDDSYNENRVVQDCGTSGYAGNNYCYDNNVYRDYANRGCNSGSCFTDTERIKQQDCGSDYCEGWGGNYCRDDDVWHSRTCYDKGCSSGSCFSKSSTEEQSVQDCGTRDCDNLNYYSIEGDNSAAGTSYCKHRYYEDCSRPCYSAACQDCSCNRYSESTQATAGACRYIEGCSGSTPGTVKNYPEGTSCGPGVCDGEGNCKVILKGDVNNDCAVNIFDLAALGLAFGSRPGDPNWNENADVTEDGLINIFDLATVGLNYGQRC